jgi:tetratricopeptide (TPR) repeat protein
VFGFALYKKAWSQANLGDYKAALATFVDLIGQCQAGKIGQAQRVPLEREARRDLVKTYARTPGADPDRAFDFFRRVGGSEAPAMLLALAELYWEEGMAAASSRVYRKVMTLEPRSPRLCGWQGKVLRNALSAGTESEQVQELQRLGASYRHVQQLAEVKADVIAECRDRYHDAARELAFVLHKQAQRLKQLATFRLAADAYRELLGTFREIEPSFYYAECLWQTATLTGADAALWRETAEQYTRVVHLDPKGQFVKEAAYAAVLAWQNALYESDDDLHGKARS